MLSGQGVAQVWQELNQGDQDRAAAVSALSKIWSQVESEHVDAVAVPLEGVDTVSIPHTLVHAWAHVRCVFG
eukprot:77807-Chlamydomonas_euryale.AAC.1